MGLGPAEDEGGLLPLPRRHGGASACFLVFLSSCLSSRDGTDDALRCRAQAALKRTLAFADFADLLWLETKAPDLVQAQTFAGEIRTAHPGKWLVYNLSPSFNWGSHGYSKEQLKSFVWDLGKAGFAIQLISLAGLHSTAVTTGASVSFFLCFGARSSSACANALSESTWPDALSLSPLARSRARRTLQDRGHARLRRAHPAEGKGHRLRRLHAPEVVRRVVQRPGAQRCVLALPLRPSYSKRALTTRSCAQRWRRALRQRRRAARSRRSTPSERRRSVLLFPSPLTLV